MSVVGILSKKDLQEHESGNHLTLPSHCNLTPSGVIYETLYQEEKSNAQRRVKVTRKLKLCVSPKGRIL